MAANPVVFTSQLPSKAVAPDGKDLVGPAADLLRGLSLLPKQGDSAGIGAAFMGTPDSVSVEAGATALSKMWAIGLGASMLAIWTSVGVWWGKQEGEVQVGVLGAAGVVTAAIVLSLAYIVGSDVRGRALSSGRCSWPGGRRGPSSDLVYLVGGWLLPIVTPALVLERLEIL